MTKAPISVSKGSDYECLVLIRHDGVNYVPGSRINLTAEYAKQLLACGAVKETRAAPKGE